MILLLRHDASDADITELGQRLDELGFESSRLDGVRGRALEVRGEHVHELIALRSHPAVEVCSRTKRCRERTNRSGRTARSNSSSCSS